MFKDYKYIAQNGRPYEYGIYVPDQNVYNDPKPYTWHLSGWWGEASYISGEEATMEAAHHKARQTIEALIGEGTFPFICAEWNYNFTNGDGRVIVEGNPQKGKAKWSVFLGYKARNGIDRATGRADDFEKAKKKAIAKLETLDRRMAKLKAKISRQT